MYLSFVMSLPNYHVFVISFGWC